jgi:hypothetical protein
MTNAVRSYGRMRTFDLPPSRDAGAQKKLVASFHGDHYVAERSGSTLEIFCLTDEHGMPASEYRGTGDRKSVIRTLHDLNARNAVIHRRA